MKQVKKVNPKYGTCKKLKEVFEVSAVTISKALNGRSDSNTAKKIRQAAIEMGGDPIYGRTNQ